MIKQIITRGLLILLFSGLCIFNLSAKDIFIFGLDPASHSKIKAYGFESGFKVIFIDMEQINTLSKDQSLIVVDFGTKDFSNVASKVTRFILSGGKVIWLQVARGDSRRDSYPLDQLNDQFADKLGFMFASEINQDHQSSIKGEILAELFKDLTIGYPRNDVQISNFIVDSKGSRTKGEIKSKSGKMKILSISEASFYFICIPGWDTGGQIIDPDYSFLFNDAIDFFDNRLAFGRILDWFK